MDRFPICFPYTHIQECPFPNDWNNPKNYSHDRHDPGGATFHGIIQREFDLWRKGHSLPTIDVRGMAEEECLAIYRIGYWNPHCPNLVPGVDMSFFDDSVNMGTTEATKIMQFSVGVKNDGLWGPITSAAVQEAMKDPHQLITNLTSRRQHVYEMMSGFQWFGEDWTRRTSEIGQQSLRMASGAVV